MTSQSSSLLLTGSVLRSGIASTGVGRERNKEALESRRYRTFRALHWRLEMV